MHALGDERFLEEGRTIPFRIDQFIQLLDLIASLRTLSTSVGGEGEGSAEPGTLVVKRNFCTIDVDGAWGERRLVLRAFDAAGGELWTRELHSRELRYP